MKFFVIAFSLLLTIVSLADDTTPEYQAWANAQNERAYLDAEYRHDDYLTNRGPLTEYKTKVGTTPRYRFNGQRRLKPFQTMEYTRIYPDHNDNGGGPVIVINPYVKPNVKTYESQSSNYQPPVIRLHDPSRSVSPNVRSKPSAAGG